MANMASVRRTRRITIQVMIDDLRDSGAIDPSMRESYWMERRGSGGML
jgi:hypothetical protein